MSTADFLERRDPSESVDVLREMRDALHSKGCTWLRFHPKPSTGELIMEGWLKRPEDEGPLPT